MQARATAPREGDTPTATARPRRPLHTMGAAIPGAAGALYKHSAVNRETRAAGHYGSQCPASRLDQRGPAAWRQPQCIKAPGAARASSPAARSRASPGLWGSRLHDNRARSPVSRARRRQRVASSLRADRVCLYVLKGVVGSAELFWKDPTRLPSPGRTLSVAFASLFLCGAATAAAAAAGVSTEGQGGKGAWAGGETSRAPAPARRSHPSSFLSAAPAPRPLPAGGRWAFVPAGPGA